MRSDQRWFSVFVLLGAVLLMRTASAEQGCADGYAPTTTPNGVQCAPIPGLYRGTGAASTPSERWATRWGAIALDSASGSTGIAGGLASERNAKQAALAQCASKGGTDCRIQIAYSNQCGAIAWGGGQAVAAREATLEKASEMAVQQCQRLGGSQCKVFFSDCSFPERLR